MRIGVSSITFHARASMGGQICLPYAKILKCYTLTLLNYYLQPLSLLFPCNEYAYLFGRYLTQIRMCAGCITFPGMEPRAG